MSSQKQSIQLSKSTIASKVSINIDLSNERISMQVTKHRNNCKNPLIYACNFCGRKFTTDSQRRRHEKSHIEKPYACEFCAKRFDFRVMLIKHLKKCFGPKKNNYCNVKCEPESVMKHDAKYAPKNVTKHFQCKVCHKIFPTNETYEKHFVDVHIKNRLKCHECSFIFQHRDALDEHVRNPINTNKMYPCNVCVKEFSNIKCLNCHKEIAHRIRYREAQKSRYSDSQFEEDYFGDPMDFETMYSDSDGSMLSNDLEDRKPILNYLDQESDNSTHSPSTKNLAFRESDSFANSKNTSLRSLWPHGETPEFETSISKRSSLRKNRKNVSYEDSLVDDIVFESDNEMKVSDSKGISARKQTKVHSPNNFNKHNQWMNVSSTGLPLCCVELEKLSDKKIALLTGQKEKKIPSVVENVDSPSEILRQIGIEPREAIGRKCNCCDSVFKSSQEKIQHMRLLHKKLVYKCKDCEKLFKNRCNLSRHYIGQHAGINFFKCRLCDRAFNYKDSLNRHVKLHYQENRFPCKICGERFIDLYELKIHKESHDIV